MNCKKTSRSMFSCTIWEFSTFMSNLLCNESLKYLPAAIHGPKTLSKVCFVTALPLYIMTADLQNWLIHKIHRQLLTGQVNPKTLLKGVNKEKERFDVLSMEYKMANDMFYYFKSLKDFLLPCISEGTSAQPQIQLPPWFSADLLG